MKPFRTHKWKEITKRDYECPHKLRVSLRAHECTNVHCTYMHIHMEFFTMIIDIIIIIANTILITVISSSSTSTFSSLSLLACSYWILIFSFHYCIKIHRRTHVLLIIIIMTSFIIIATVVRTPKQTTIEKCFPWIQRQNFHFHKIFLFFSMVLNSKGAGSGFHIENKTIWGIGSRAGKYFLLGEKKWILLPRPTGSPLLENHKHDQLR